VVVSVGDLVIEHALLRIPEPQNPVEADTRLLQHVREPVVVVVGEGLGMAGVCGEHEAGGVSRRDEKLDVVAGIVPASVGPHARTVGRPSLRDAVLEMAFAMPLWARAPAALHAKERKALREQARMSVIGHREDRRVHCAEPQEIGSVRGEAAEVELVDVSEPAVAAAIAADFPAEDHTTAGAGFHLETVPLQVPPAQCERHLRVDVTVADLVQAEVHSRRRRRPFGRAQPPGRSHREQD